MFGAELRFYRTRAGLSQKDLAARATVSHDVISKIETGERSPAGDFPPRLDAVPELDTRGALTRLWDHLKKGQKQRLYGWFQQWAGIEAQATVLRWYEPLTAAQIGSVLTRIQCSMATYPDTHAPPSHLANDTATALSAGTSVHAVKGFSPRCRLAAYVASKPRTYVGVNNTKHGPVFRACAKVAAQ